jgi:hypothetical protein
MVAVINSTSTKVAGWQEKCWTWAEAKQPFEVRDMQAEHFMFCQELCAEYEYTYQYRCQRTESVAKFTPLH